MTPPSKFWRSDAFLMPELPARVERPLAALLLAAAVIVRVVSLRSLPPGLRYDELLNAVNVDAILQHGPVIYITGNWGHEPLFEHVAAGMWLLFGRSAVTFRLTGALFGLLGVIVGWLLVRRLFGRTAGLLQLAALALGFVPIFYGRQALRAISLPFFTALAVYGLIRALQPDGEGKRPSSRSAWGWLALGGVALGLTLLTYPASRVVPFALLSFAIYLFIFQRDWVNGRLPHLLLFFLLAAAIAAPMFIYLNQNPAAEQRTWQLQSILEPLRQGDPRPLLTSLQKTAGMFITEGDRHWLYNYSRRPYFPLPVALLFFAGIALALTRWRQPRYALILLLLGFGLAPSILAETDPSVIRSINIINVAYLFPALALLFGMGWLLRWRPGAARLAYGGMALLALVYLGGEVNTYFNGWARHPEAHKEFAVANLALVRALEAHPEWPDVVVSSPGGSYHDPWSRVQVELLLRGDTAVRWFNGSNSLIIPQQPDPVPYFFGEGAPLDPAWGLPLTPAATFGLSDFDEFRLDDPQTAVAQLTANMLPAADGGFANGAALLGSDGWQPDYGAGDGVVFRTFWQVNGRPDTSAIVFAHIISPAGEWVAGWDRLDVASEAWQPGDFLAMRHDLLLPPALPPGDYTIMIGWYDQQTGVRVPLTIGGEAYTLHTITVR